MPKSRQSLDGKIINLRRGLAIYKTHASPFYFCRIWIPAEKKRVVKTTKMKTRAEAISVAEELFSSMGSRGKFDNTPKNKTFEHFANRLVLIQDEQIRNLSRHPVLAKLDKARLFNEKSGLVVFFRNRDVSTIKTRDLIEYVQFLRKTRPDIQAASTFNHIISCFRKVMKIARDDGLINEIPTTPRVERRDNPRAFFKFAPLVSPEKDEYKKLLSTTKSVIDQKLIVHGTPITEELYDLILFQIHTFLRPTTSEVFALRHQDVTIADNPKRTVLTIRRGKTGFRVVNSMEAAVTVYKRICQRHSDHKPTDFLFLPQQPNRSTASTIFGRQFKTVVEQAKLDRDENAEQSHTLYSLRHTAICMRLILSEGRTNIFTLAKTCGTSVDQIERFYARNLPLSAELARNLQSF